MPASDEAGTVSQWLAKYAAPKGAKFLRASDEVRGEYTVIGFSVFRRGEVTFPVLLLKNETDDNIGLVLHAPQMRDLEALAVRDLTDLQDSTIRIGVREIPGFAHRPTNSIQIEEVRAWERPRL